MSAARPSYVSTTPRIVRRRTRHRVAVKLLRWVAQTLRELVNRADHIVSLIHEVAKPDEAVRQGKTGRWYAVVWTVFVGRLKEEWQTEVRGIAKQVSLWQVVFRRLRHRAFFQGYNKCLHRYYRDVSR
jgi:hypothetical protein